MKIIEAMKDLKLIESKMKKNIEYINNYSSALDTEKLPFGSEEDQKKEVQRLIQSNNDLAERYLYLKAAIERTNLSTKVMIEGGKREYTIFELLNIKRTLSAYLKSTYVSLSPKEGNSRLVRAQSAMNSVVPKVVTFYSEREKNEKLDELERFFTSITSRLEVVNAVTDLIEQ